MKDTISIITDLLFIPKNFDVNQDFDTTIILGNDWTDTMNEVYELSKTNNLGKIFISGGAVNSETPEALTFKKRGIELGFIEDNIFVEADSTNTKENFQNLKKIIQDTIGFEKITNILIVCKTFHTRRALMTAQNFFPESLNYFFLPIEDERKIRQEDWFNSENTRARVLEEVERIAKYTIKGDLKL